MIEVLFRCIQFPFIWIVVFCADFKLIVSI